MFDPRQGALSHTIRAMSVISNQKTTIRFGLMLVMLWFVGLYLRIPVLIIPPLEPLIGRDLAFGQIASGALTTVPMLMLAVGAIGGSAVVGRLGARTGVISGLLLMALASAARGLAPTVSLLFVATVVTGLGIAVMQPALAALASRLSVTHVALAIAFYMNGMYTGEFISAGLTRVTLLPLAGGDWRLVLLLASVPVVPIVAVVAWFRGPTAGPASATEANVEPRRVALWPNWRSGVMWRLGLLQSASTVLFIGTNAYMADIVGHTDATLDLSTALFWFNLSQVLVSLALLFVAQKLVLRRAPIIVTMMVSLAGALIFVLVGGIAGLVAAFILGMVLAVQLSLLIMAAPYLAPAGETGRMTAGMFTIGYSLSFLVPLIGGIFAEWIGMPWTAMLPMIAYAAAVTPLALTLRLERSH